MKDIDLGYALFLWKTDKKGCLFCILAQDERCPKDCDKEGYYKIIMGDDFRFYNLKEQIRQQCPNFGKKHRKNDEEL